MGSIDTFVSKHLKLLQLEQDEEVKSNKELLDTLSLSALQRRGLCIVKLKIGGYKSGLYGRCICTFESFRPGNALPSHNFTPGDIAGVWDSNGKREEVASGIVNHVTSNCVHVAFDGSFESLGLNEEQTYCLVRLANNVTYERMKKILTDLSRYNCNGPASQLIQVLFGESPVSDPAVDSGNGLKFINEKLNDSQKEAIIFALSRHEVAIVHGPPGTGKTTTIVEIILQAVQRGIKVLACASSNIAVDNMVEKLARYGARIVRLGHPARTLASAQDHTLDAVLSRSDDNKIIEDMRKELDGIVAKAHKSNNKGEVQRLKHERHLVASELKRREKLALQHTLKRADVILATLISSSDKGPLKHLAENHFGLVVIDECSQALEAACWIPLVRAPKCILAGDHKQLPPTIVSKKAAAEGLEVSLMERVIKLFGDSVVKILCIQYRMHQEIMFWPSKQLYDGQLIAHETVQHHLLRDMDDVEENENTSIPLLLIDTAGCNLYELELEDEESKGNEGEADLVSIHIDNLIESGVKARDIGVITPYNLQVELLRLRLATKYPMLEIKSVDGFQGREKEAVVLSLVRSNKEGEVGFLADDRRINVAITRAKRHLAVICDSETVSRHAFLKSLLEYISSQGEVRSANQYHTEMNDRDVCRPDHLKFKGTQTKTKDKREAKKKPTKSTPEKDAPPVQYGAKRVDNTNELERRISEFVGNDTVEFLEFSPSLNSYERMVVHEIAEKLGLIHLSKGEDKARVITIYKKSFSEISESLNKTSTSTSAGTSTAEDFKMKTTNSEGSPVNRVPENTTAEKNASPQRRVPKPKKPKPVTSSKPAETEGDDFDELVAQAAKQNTKCAFDRCKTSIVTLNQKCRFCTSVFCLSHSLPEVHGCGESAKRHARSQIRKVQPAPVRQSDTTKRAQLQNKMDKKLAEMSKQRKAKP